jgi:phosphoribosylglycinamide formyltransferase-1
LVRLSVFASGQGSNLQAIYYSILNGTLHSVELALVISNNSNSGAMLFAKEHEIPAVHLSILKFGNDEDMFASAMLAELEENHIEFIVLAGYMKRLPDIVLKTYTKRIINIHPALLPEFGGAGMYGMNVHNTVIAQKKEFSGATVHYVEGDYDTGEIILQAKCPVLKNDTPQSLAERVQKIEHTILPQAIQIVADSIENNR